MTPPIPETPAKNNKLDKLNFPLLIYTWGFFCQYLQGVVYWNEAKGIHVQLLFVSMFSLFETWFDWPYWYMAKMKIIFRMKEMIMLTASIYPSWLSSLSYKMHVIQCLDDGLF